MDKGVLDTSAIIKCIFKPPKSLSSGIYKREMETHKKCSGDKAYMYKNRIQSMQLTYTDLLSSFRKGLRNGNWRKLRSLEKALFQASLWYSRRQGTIINEMVVDKLSVLVEKLKVTKGARIFKRGYEKADVLLSNAEKIFAWAPSFKEWLKDMDYVFWLGAGGLRIGT